MRKKPALLRFLLPLAALAAFQPARADELVIGIGAGYAPQFEGSNDYQAFPLPSFSYENDYLSIKTNQLGLEADLIPGKAFGAGPIVQYDFGRDPEEIDNRVVARLTAIDPAVRAGGFVEAALPAGDLGIGPMFLNARISAVQAFGDTNDGFVADGSLGMFTLAGPWSLGASLTAAYGDEEHMRDFFSVSALDSLASGLPRFDAQAGIKDIGAEAFVGYALDEKWSVSVFGKVSKLVGDASESPIVAIEGERNQFFIGASVSYKLF